MDEDKQVLTEDEAIAVLKAGIIAGQTMVLNQIKSSKE